MTRTAVVTGAAGAIGRSICARFRDAGWRTIGLDLEDCPAAQVDTYANIDLADCDAIEAAILKIGSSEGSIDALINNAAHQVEKPLMTTSVIEWDRVMHVNARAPFWLLRCAVPYMRHGGASVVNVASIHAQATSAGLAAYVASKGALVAFTRAAALELAGDGIRVNAVLPGAVDTPMLDRGLERDQSATDLDDARRRLAMRHPIGRIGVPADIAESVFFLADSTRSSFITGQQFVLDGGALAQLSTE